MTNMTMIDNVLGINLQAAGEQRVKSHTWLRDSQVYGETEAQDCPEGHTCKCMDKHGFMLFGSNHGGKSILIDSPSPRPHYKIKSYGVWAATTDVSNTRFEKFTSNETDCGARQRIFELNHYASDHIPVQKFKYTTFADVHQDALAYLMDPPSGWANPDDCVGFPCTAPSNVVMLFESTTFEGQVKPVVNDRDFQIVSDTPGASETLDNCDYQEIWNAWHCTNDNLGILVFIATDSDWEDRSVAPIYVTNEVTGFTNKLNSQMDHMWDGFYTGQKHKSQFSSMIQTTGNYTVEYTGTPFNNMRYIMRSNQGQIKVKVPYWNAGSYSVWVNDERIEYTEWDKHAGRQSELSGYKGCGENRYVGVQNFLEFILTPGCEVTIKPEDAILCNVRMQWTMAEFYAAGGTTSFTDRVAGALGIHASQIKTVAVYTGSVVVDYIIEADTESDTDIDRQLRTITRKLNTLVKNNDSTVFGAPILSANTDGEVIVEDVTYNPQANVNNIVNEDGSVSTPLVKPPSRPVTTSVTTEEEVPIVEEAAQGSLIAILIVLVLICVCCFGIGTVCICCTQALPNSDQVELPKTQQKIAGIAGVDLQSECDLKPQYNPDQQFEIDIFRNNKKRVLKINDDLLTEQIDHNTEDVLKETLATNPDMIADSSVMNLSEQKLVVQVVEILDDSEIKIQDQDQDQEEEQVLEQE